MIKGLLRFVRREILAIIGLVPIAIVILIIIAEWPLTDATFRYVEL